MLKILQARLQQYVNCEVPDVQAGNWKSNRVPEKHLLLIYWLCQSLWLCGGGLVAKSCPTLATPWIVVRQAPLSMGFWIAISFSRGSFRPRNRTWFTCIAGRFFTNWAMREALTTDCVDHNKLENSSRVGNNRSPYLPPEKSVCRSRNKLELDMEQSVDWFQIGKGVLQGCILSPCLFNLYAEYIMRKSGLDEAEAGIKITGRNINNLRYADDTTLMAKSEEELKSLLMKVKEDSEEVGLKLNIQKAKIMASVLITSWQVDGETMETVTGFIFLGSKITADGDCSHEIKRPLLLGRKVMTNLDSILKSRDITLPTKVHLVKVMVFRVVMYGCESWTIKKAEHRRIDAFELWCWRRLLRVTWTARRSNQSILNETSPKYSLEGLMRMLKLQYFGHLMWRTGHWKRSWCWQRLKVGREGDDRGWDGWIASLTQWTWVWVSSRSWWWTGKPGVLQSMGSQRVGHDWEAELNWTGD